MTMATVELDSAQLLLGGGGNTDAATVTPQRNSEYGTVGNEDLVKPLPDSVCRRCCCCCRRAAEQVPDGRRRVGCCALALDFYVPFNPVPLPPHSRALDRAVTLLGLLAFLAWTVWTVVVYVQQPPLSATRIVEVSAPSAATTFNTVFWEFEAAAAGDRYLAGYIRLRSDYANSACEALVSPDAVQIDQRWEFNATAPKRIYLNGTLSLCRPSDSDIEWKNQVGGALGYPVRLGAFYGSAFPNDNASYFNMKIWADSSRKVFLWSNGFSSASRSANCQSTLTLVHVIDTVANTDVYELRPGAVVCTTITTQTTMDLRLSTSVVETTLRDGRETVTLLSAVFSLASLLAWLSAWLHRSCLLPVYLREKRAELQNADSVQEAAAIV